MHTWFECKIRYEKVMENGMNKKVTEPYLVDALSFTEAEARIIALDEKSGAEKKTSTTVLVQASDLRDAVKKLDEGMKGTMADYQIASVAETAIMDVYPYEAKEVPISNTQISEGADSPVVRNFIQSLQDGCRTTITVAGKQVVVDKTGKDTVVTPHKEKDDDIRGDD